MHLDYLGQINKWNALECIKSNKILCVVYFINRFTRNPLKKLYGLYFDFSESTRVVCVVPLFLKICQSHKSRKE